MSQNEFENTQEELEMCYSRQMELENALNSVIDLIDQHALILNVDCTEDEALEADGIIEKALQILEQE
jgi:hypothetical protein